MHRGNELRLYWSPATNDCQRGECPADESVGRVIDLPAEAAQALETRIADGPATGRQGYVIDRDVAAVGRRDAPPGCGARGNLRRSPGVLGSSDENDV